MKRFLIYVYWLLLLVPTMVIGVAAFALVRREQDRLEANHQRTMREIARNQAVFFARRVSLNLQAVQNDVEQRLAAIPTSNLVPQLEALNENSPFVRNVFVWSPRDGLRFPDPKQPGTDERRRFISRYEALFTGNIEWVPVMDIASPTEPTNKPIQALNKSIHTSNTFPNFDSFKTWRKYNKRAENENQEDYAQSSGVQQAADQSSQRKQQFQRQQETQQRQVIQVIKPPARKAWIPWFAENRLHMLGWIQPENGLEIRGVELEMMSFLSRLYSGSPGQTIEEESGKVHCTLQNGSGTVLYEEGEPLQNGISVTIPVGADLPHWQVTCHLVPKVASRRNGNTVIVLSGLLAGIFLLTILLGGSLLLWQARKDARELVQKTSFVSNVSHELKTPLTSIRMYAELMGERRITDEKKRQRYLDVIVTESQRLSRLVNNVLDFSRLEQGRKKYHPEELDINQCVNDILQNQQLRLNECGMEVNVQLSPDPIVVKTDRDALEQVVINLLDNACKYAQDGKEVTIQSCAEDEYATIRILDRGPGIERKQEERVFEKFYRADDSLTRRQDGVGLGLSIAKRLMLDQRGDISYGNRDGGGACFTIKLPR